MEPRTRERLTGAAILVALVVLLVPELLSGPRRAAPQPAAAVDEPPVRSYTLPLGDTAPQGAVAPGAAMPTSAMPATAAPENATAQSATPHSGALPSGTPHSAAPPSGTRHSAVPPSGTPHGGASKAATAPGATPQGATSQRGTPAAARRAVGVSPAVAERGAHEGNASAAAANGAAVGHAWMVQVGSFGSRENADRLARQLKLKGYGAFVSESTSRGRKWYRVRIGPERDRAAASAVVARLRASGQKGAVAQPR